MPGGWSSFIERLRQVMRQRETDEQTSEPTVNESRASDPVMALIPVESEQTKRTPFALSDVRRPIHRLRVWTRRGMMICLVGALACSLAVPVLSSFRVKRIEVQGNEHHTTEEILGAAEVKVGDESLLCSSEDMRARILAGCSYIKQVQVSCGLANIQISVTECSPRWAWLLEDGQAVLLDEERYVAETCTAESVPSDICRLLLPPIRSDAESEADPIRAGTYYTGEASVMTLLSQMEDALDGTALFSPPSLLDMSNRYDVVLELEDGSRIDLNECSRPQQQLRAVSRGLAAYLNTHPNILDSASLHVNVDDSLLVTVRPVPREAASKGEKTAE